MNGGVAQAARVAAHVEQETAWPRPAGPIGARLREAQRANAAMRWACDPPCPVLSEEEFDAIEHRHLAAQAALKEAIETLLGVSADELMDALL